MKKSYILLLTIFFFLLQNCLYAVTVNQNLCRCTDLTFEVIDPGAVCEFGGKNMTISNYKLSENFIICNEAAANETISAANTVFFPAYPFLFNNLTSLSVKAALDIASLNFVDMSSSVISPGGVCSAGGIAFTFSNLNESVTINQCNQTSFSYTVNSITNGTSLISSSTSTSTTMKSLENSTTLEWTGNNANIRGNVRLYFNSNNYIQIIDNGNGNYSILFVGSFVSSTPSTLAIDSNNNNGTTTFGIVGSTITSIYNFTSSNCDVGSFIFTAAGVNYTVCRPVSSATTTFNNGTNIQITDGTGGNNKTVSTVPNPSFSSMTLTTPLGVGSGGTGVGSLTGNGLLSANSGGTGVNSTPMLDGQLPIGNTGNAPTIGTISGTTNQTSVTNGPGTITLGWSLTALFPGFLSYVTNFYRSLTNTISAAGATQGTATALTLDVNVVTTVAASTGVRLFTPTKAGAFVTVINKGANTLNVYPAVGGAIDAAGTNIAVTIPAGASATYEAATTTQWYTIGFPLVAGSNVNSITYGNGQASVAVTAELSLASNTVALVQNNPGAATFVTMVPTVAGTLTVPAILAAGSKVNFDIGGYYSIAGTTTVTFRLRMDGATIYTSAASPNTGASTNTRLSVKGTWSIFTGGAGGTMLGTGFMNAETASCAIISTTTTAFDATVSHTFDVQFAFSTLNAANTFTITSFLLYITKV